LLEIAFDSDTGSHGTLLMDRQRMQSLTRLVPSALSLIETCQPDRRRIESFIEEIYARRYRSTIARHYSTLMGVHDQNGGVVAAVGLRLAADEPLFLEHYLQRTVEAGVREATGRIVARDRIVEIGNLASAGKGASVFLFVVLAAYLRRHDLAYAVVTATKAQRRSFTRLGIDFTELGDANPDALPDSGAAWGSYYTHDPKVLVGAIPPSFARLERLLPTECNSHLKNLFSRFRPSIMAAAQ